MGDSEYENINQSNQGHNKKMGYFEDQYSFTSSKKRIRNIDDEEAQAHKKYNEDDDVDFSQLSKDNQHLNRQNMNRLINLLKNQKLHTVKELSQLENGVSNEESKSRKASLNNDILSPEEKHDRRKKLYSTKTLHANNKKANLDDVDGIDRIDRLLDNGEYYKKGISKSKLGRNASNIN